MRAILLLGALLCGFWVANLRAASPADSVKDARMAGGLVVQVGSDDLGLKDLGDRFRVRILLQDSAAVEKAQAAIASAGLLGRFTVSTWDGRRLRLIPAARFTWTKMRPIDGMFSLPQELHW